MHVHALYGLDVSFEGRDVPSQREIKQSAGRSKKCEGGGCWEEALGKLRLGKEGILRHWRGAGRSYSRTDPGLLLLLGGGVKMGGESGQILIGHLNSGVNVHPKREVPKSGRRRDRSA